MMKDEKIVFKGRSPVQTILLTKLNDGQHALYLDGHIQLVSGLDDTIYHRALAAVPAKMLGGKPSRAIIFGGGDGCAARELLAFPNIKDITLVEIDPGIVEFSRKHPVMKKLNRGSLSSKRVNVQIGDARNYVGNGEAVRHNLAVIDFLDPKSSFDDLYSSEFYQGIVSRMDPEPIVAVQAADSYGEAEKMVHQNLAEATGTRPKVARFKGKWMFNGSVIIAGKGMQRGG